METITGLGGDWLVPMALRIMPRTMANRTKDVVEIKKNGAMLMDDMASKRFTDELNCSGWVKESKSMAMDV